MVAVTARDRVKRVCVCEKTDHDTADRYFTYHVRRTMDSIFDGCGVCVCVFVKRRVVDLEE